MQRPYGGENMVNRETEIKRLCGWNRVPKGRIGEVRPMGG